VEISAAQFEAQGFTACSRVVERGTSDTTGNHPFNECTPAGVPAAPVLEHGQTDLHEADLSCSSHPKQRVCGKITVLPPVVNNHGAAPVQPQRVSVTRGRIRFMLLLTCTSLLLAACYRKNSVDATTATGMQRLGMLHQMATKFAEEHDGQWPSTLEQLAEYGISRGVPEIRNWTSWPYEGGAQLRYSQPLPGAPPTQIVVVTPIYSVEGEPRYLELTKGGRVHRRVSGDAH